MITDMVYNKKLNSIVTKLFIRGRIFNSSLVLLSFFKVLKDFRLNFTHFFQIKTPNKKELQQIPLNHLLDIYFKDFIRVYKKYNAELYSFPVNDATQCYTCIR